MDRTNRNLLGRAALTVAAALTLSFVQPAWAQVAQNDAEVQTRGPIHEAFAEVTDINPSAGFVVPGQQPQPNSPTPRVEQPRPQPQPGGSRPPEAGPKPDRGPPQSGSPQPPKDGDKGGGKKKKD